MSDETTETTETTETDDERIALEVVDPLVAMRRAVLASLDRDLEKLQRSGAEAAQEAERLARQLASIRANAWREMAAAPDSPDVIRWKVEQARLSGRAEAFEMAAAHVRKLGINKLTPEANWENPETATEMTYLATAYSQLVQKAKEQREKQRQYKETRPPTSEGLSPAAPPTPESLAHSG